MRAQDLPSLLDRLAGRVLVRAPSGAGLAATVEGRHRRYGDTPGKTGFEPATSSLAIGGGPHPSDHFQGMNLCIRDSAEVGMVPHEFVPLTETCGRTLPRLFFEGPSTGLARQGVGSGMNEAFFLSFVSSLRTCEARPVEACGRRRPFAGVQGTVGARPFARPQVRQLPQAPSDATRLFPVAAEIGGFRHALVSDAARVGLRVVRPDDRRL
jgi:hypothetical protein